MKYKIGKNKVIIFVFENVLLSTFIKTAKLLIGSKFVHDISFTDSAETLKLKVKLKVNVLRPFVPLRIFHCSIKLESENIERKTQKTTPWSR